MDGWIRGGTKAEEKLLEESKTSGTCPFNVSTHLRCRDPRTTNTMMSSAKNGNMPRRARMKLVTTDLG
eukprot:scaffold2203_cov106-Cylindrotheca_fusiformis.AAC.2